MRFQAMPRKWLAAKYVKKGINKKMKYYSETLNRLFDSEEELNKAELKVKVEEQKKKELAAQKEKAEAAKKAERTKRAKEVEDAIKAAREAQNKVSQLLTDFTKDYGYFHTSFSYDDIGENNIFDFLGILNKFLD